MWLLCLFVLFGNMMGSVIELCVIFDGVFVIVVFDYCIDVMWFVFD